ncbi:TolC family outer membrane protein [Candidatus Halobeggiatoa sp. HSG11]|nr:TolC family outer membrane protein [Candidatus Halobeggiatoa sp. HSG11]
MPIQAENLLELYKLAEQHNPQLKIADSERLVAQQKKPQAQAPLSPQVTLTANAVENWNDNGGQDMENTTIGYNASLSYAIYRRNLNIQLKQTDGIIIQAEANYETAKQALIKRLADSYFAVLAASDNIEFTLGAKKAFLKQLDDAKQRFEVGLIAITDVQEAQAGYDLAVADVIAAQNQLDNSHESLRSITGTYHEILATLKTEAPVMEPKTNELDVWTEIALQQNPQILAIQQDLEVATQEVAKQRAANLPTLDLVSNFNHSDSVRGDENQFGNKVKGASVGLQLNYSLYSGGIVQSRIKEAQQRRIQTLDRLEQQRRTVQMQTRQAFLNLLSNISKIKALQQALKSTQIALKAIQTGFDLGTRTSVDVVNAQRDLLRAQSNHSTARYAYVLSTLQLKQAAGMLSLDDLKIVNGWLIEDSKL